jgi:metalloendopeptidase OMA1, mitochondrial
MDGHHHVARRSRLWWRVVPIALALAAVGYQFFGAPEFTNPETGRTARLGLTEAQESALGLQGFREILAQSRVVTSGPAYEQVVRVSGRLARVMTDAVRFDWQVAVIDDPAQNAFCLPGGKICVYTGILPITRSDDGLAVVLGHEMAHASCHHGAERVLRQNMTQTALIGVQGSIGDLDHSQQRALMGLLGAGAQYGILLPFSRSHESEADLVGLKYMTRAGYDPREAVGFWTRMAAASGGGDQPEFASTHPLHETRIRQIEAWLPEVLKESPTRPEVERPSIEDGP